jgi:hypothetical protein
MVVELEERLDDDLLREEVAGGEDHQHRDVEPPGEPAADKGDSAREQERQDDRRDKNQRRIPLLAHDVSLLPGIPVIIQRQGIRPGEHTLWYGL